MNATIFVSITYIIFLKGDNKQAYKHIPFSGFSVHYYFQELYMCTGIVCQGATKFNLHIIYILICNFRDNNVSLTELQVPLKACKSCKDPCLLFP